jgi:hypothetical protein
MEADLRPKASGCNRTWLYRSRVNTRIGSATVADQEASGEITAVTVSEVEAVRDLVRAREDARADLMRVRHRLSKLLLRQGRVYSGGQAWNGVHETWLRRQRFDVPTPPRPSITTSMRSCQRRRLVIVSTSRSWRWRPYRAGLTRSTGWGVYGESRC